MSFMQSAAGILVETKGDGKTSASKGRLAFVILLSAACFIWIHSYLKHGKPVEISEYHFWMMSALLAYNFGKKTSVTNDPGGGKPKITPNPTPEKPAD